MFGMPSTRPVNAAETAAPETTPIAEPRRDRVELQLVVASVTMVDLERYADRAPVSLRHELAPRLTRLRDIETKCAEWLRHPQAFDSPTLPTTAALLQDESDALLALGMSLTPQAFTHHLQRREALAERGRTAMGLLPGHERTCEAARAYFDALMRLDTTDDARRLPEALVDVQTALDELCAFVARLREADRRQTAARSALRPSEQCPGITRTVLDRKRRMPDPASSTPLSTAMPPPREIPKRWRSGGPGLPATQVAAPAGSSPPPSTPDFSAPPVAPGFDRRPRGRPFRAPPIRNP